MSGIRVIPIPLFSDNYSYLIIDEGTKQGAIVDAAEPAKVIPVLQAEVLVRACNDSVPVVIECLIT
jgi:glyoxylase-like metal-dependent hydrolase (beta-lactamase superfamily II)